MAIEGRQQFYEIFADPTNIRKEHRDCIKKLVGTVVLKHFPMNNNPDFIDEFVSEFFLKVLTIMQPDHPSYFVAKPTVNYGNYCYSLIRNTIINSMSREFRYGLDLMAISYEDYTESIQPEVAVDSYILSKYGDALLGTCYAVVAEEDVDVMLDFLNSKGVY